MSQNRKEHTLRPLLVLLSEDMNNEEVSTVLAFVLVTKLVGGKKDVLNSELTRVVYTIFLRAFLKNG